jgi:hypothetical protein
MRFYEPISSISGQKSGFGVKIGPGDGVHLITADWLMTPDQQGSGSFLSEVILLFRGEFLSDGTRRARGIKCRSSLVRFIDPTPIKALTVWHGCLGRKDSHERR